MAKKTKQVRSAADRSKRTPEESLKRMEEFSKRKEKFIATVRKGKS